LTFDLTRVPVNWSRRGGINAQPDSTLHDFFMEIVSGRTGYFVSAGFLTSGFFSSGLAGAAGVSPFLFPAANSSFVSLSSLLASSFPKCLVALAVSF
jgi:hypothetical protein